MQKERMAVNLYSKNPTAIICLSPNAGGMELDAIKLAKKLSSHTSITLIAKYDCFIANSKNDYIGYNGIELETIPFLFSISPSIIFKVRRIIQDKGIRNVIFFGASELKSLYFSFIGLHINLIIRHGTTKSTPKKDWFHRLIYSNVNYHITICAHLQKNVEYIIPFGKNTQNILIYSSVKMDTFNKIPHDKLVLLHVGRIELGKGQADAIKACQILYENGINFTFYIVGKFDKTYKSSFMTLYHTLPYKENIVLVGHTDNVTKYYAKSDIFLFPSYGEGLSNAFLEALGHGLECISYDNTSFPELRDLGFFFYIAKHKNIDELKKILLNTVNQYDENSPYTLSNKNKIQKDFHPDIEINNYLQILI